MKSVTNEPHPETSPEEQSPSTYETLNVELVVSQFPDRNDMRRRLLVMNDELADFRVSEDEIERGLDRIYGKLPEPVVPIKEKARLTVLQARLDGLI